MEGSVAQIVRRLAKTHPMCTRHPAGVHASVRVLAVHLISFSSVLICPHPCWRPSSSTRPWPTPAAWGPWRPSSTCEHALAAHLIWLPLVFPPLQASKQQHKTLANPSSLGAMEAIQHRDFANGIVSETATLSDRTLRNIFRTPELFFAKIGLYVSRSANGAVVACRRKHGWR